MAIAALGLTLSRCLAQPAFEAIASILIGIVLMLEAHLLGVECRGLRVGEAARPAVIANIRSVAARYSEIGPIESLRTLQLGPDAVMLVLGIRLPLTATAGALEAIVSRLATDLRLLNPAIKDLLLDLRASGRA